MKIKTTKALTIFTALLLMIVSLPGKTVNAATNTTYYWPVSNTKVNSPYGNRKAPVEGATLPWQRIHPSTPLQLEQ